jgi:hypothetical protein
MMLYCRIAVILVTGALALSSPFQACAAQTMDMKIPPSVCSGLQARIDEMTNLSQSPLSQDEKLNRLKNIWDKSWSDALKKAGEDKETLTMLQSMGGYGNPIAVFNIGISKKRRNERLKIGCSGVRRFEEAD